MPDTAVTLPFYAMPPGTAGPTPKGIYHDPLTSHKMTRTLLKGMRPFLKGKAKGKGKAKQPTRSAKPATATKK